MTEDHTELIAAAKEAALNVREASALREAALRRRRIVAQQLRAQDLTYDQIGAALGVPRQRVQKVLDGNAPPKTKRKKKT